MSLFYIQLAQGKEIYAYINFINLWLEKINYNGLVFETFIWQNVRIKILKIPLEIKYNTKWNNEEDWSICFLISFFHMIIISNDWELPPKKLIIYMPLLFLIHSDFFKFFLSFFLSFFYLILGLMEKKKFMKMDFARKLLLRSLSLWSLKYNIKSLIFFRYFKLLSYLILVLKLKRN